MNGLFVYQQMKECPPESLALEPYPDAFNVGAYFDARRATERLEGKIDDPQTSADVLSRYLFHRHPDSLNLASELAYRYEQARGYMRRFPGGSEILASRLLGYFEGVQECLEASYIAMQTPTAISADPTRQRNELVEGESCQRVYLPNKIQQRSLAWNNWAQEVIKAGGIDELFTDTIYRHGAKVAAGTLLPAGNLWVEVGEGLARVRTRIHRDLNVEDEWGIPSTNVWGSGLDFWFVMSHIAEKGILELSESIQPGMVDGMHLTPEVYAQSYKTIVDLIDINPHLDIKGILSDGSWIYSQELAAVFPNQNVSKLHDIAGKVIELGPARKIGLPIHAMFATLSPERREAYDVGDYKASVAARFIDRAGMVAVLESFGISATT